MDEIVISTLDEKVNISFSGRIDSEFASRNTEKVIEELKKTTELTLDFQNVEYISSAGLRLILKCAKIAKSCAVINVNTNVYEVFSISGFTEMIKIQRKKRELSIEGKELIGEGANGKVYHYDIDTIVKVYKDCSQMNYIENEIAMSKKAFVLGVPTAIPFDIVKIKEGSYGCVYELVKSDVLASLIAKYPEKIDDFTKLFADALSKFLHTETYDKTLPDKMEYAETWVTFLENKKKLKFEIISRARMLLKTVDNGHTLIHGDFHIKNVMIQNEEPIIIDMDTLGIGHPIFELASTYYAMVGFDKDKPAHAYKFFGVRTKVLSKMYKDTFDMIFKDKTEEEKEDIQNKVELLANLRIAYRCYHHLPNDTKKGALAIKYIKENIFKLNTLDFKL